MYLFVEPLYLNYFYLYYQGWEEIVNGSITYLLKTVLAKATKDTAVMGSTLEVCFSKQMMCDGVRYFNFNAIMSTTTIFMTLVTDM